MYSMMEVVETDLDSGDTAWVLMATALVMVMTPGLGFFYGGMVRQKNVISLIMQCFLTLMLISVQWVLWGYTLAFGSSFRGVIGGFEWLGLQGVGLNPNPTYAATIPHAAFVMFQAMFAAITPALIVGAFAERVKINTLIIFILLWSTFVYDPVAHWVWGSNGWLRQLGVLDFAGGAVVHINAGAAALASAFVLRRRIGFGSVAMEPHNIPFVALGTALLWFGWFGFNAGSALTAGVSATNAFMVTNTASAAAGLTWMLMSWYFRGRPSVLGSMAGVVAGLVAITPAAGFVNPLSAIVIGVGAGFFCYVAVVFRVRRQLDDSLDVWGVHGIGGTWGAIATGIFAEKALGGVDGLLFGRVEQLVGVAAVWVYSFTVSLLIFKALDTGLGFCVKPEEEEVGLDISQHGEKAYASF
jgi:Amt family ammonium transporter